MTLQRAVRYVLLTCVVAGDFAILRAPHHAVASVLLVLATAGLAAALVVLEHRQRRLPLAPVVVAIAITLLAAVWTPPRTSNDLWSYAMYGRMVTVYDKSPYDHVPAEFRPDPFVHRVSPLWRHRASIYGPLFVGVAAFDAWIAGPSPLAARLFFQSVAALALIVTLLVVWRTTRHLAAVMFLGLNPVLVVIVVNGGHNDALIGLALLIAAMCAFRCRPRAAGAVIGLAALVKLTAGLALVGLLLWAWRHQLKRFAIRVTTTFGVVVLIGYLPVLAAASHVLGDADKTVTNGSPWNWIVDRLLGHDAWRNVRHPLAPNPTLRTFFYVGAAVVLLMAVSSGWLAARRAHPGEAVGVSLAAYPVGAEYAYPWYSAWALPLFASSELTALSAVVWLHSIVLLAALKLPIAVRGSPADATLRVLLTDVAPPMLLAAFIVVAVRQYGWTRRSSGASTDPVRGAAQGYVDDAAAIVPAGHGSPADGRHDCGG